MFVLPLGSLMARRCPCLPVFIMVVGHSVSLLVREAAIGSALGLGCAMVWLLTITKPVQARITDYYKK